MTILNLLQYGNFALQKKVHTLTQVFGSIAKSLYIQFRSKIILLIKTIRTWSNRISHIPPRIYPCKKLTSVPQSHACKPILVQVEDVKIIGQKVFVFDSIEQALSVCHVCAYILATTTCKTLETSCNTCLFTYTYNSTWKTLRNYKARHIP